MAKVLVVSDNHGYKDTLEKIIEAEKPLDLMIHCGDIVFSDEITQLTKMADCPVYAVRGNCDIYSDLPRAVDFNYAGHHILVTHGYYEGVNMGCENLYRKALMTKSDIVFFGHTHVPYKTQIEEVLIANPGSTDRPRQSDRIGTYMIMNIGQDIETEFIIKRCSN